MGSWCSWAWTKVKLWGSIGVESIGGLGKCFSKQILMHFCWCLAFLHIHVCTFFGGWCMREQVQEQCLGMKVKLWGSCGAWGYGATVAQQPVQNMTKSKRGKWWSLILGKAASYIALWNSSHHIHINYIYQTLRGGKASPLILRSRDMQDSARSLYISFR